MNLFIMPPAPPLLDVAGDNRKKRLIILLVAVLLFSLLTATVVFACNCGAVKGEHKKGTFPCKEGWDALTAAAYDFKAATIAGIFPDMGSLYKFDISSSDSGAGKVWALIKPGYETIVPIGYFLVILYFILDIIERSTLDNLNAETLVKSSIKLFIAVYLISNGLNLLEGAASFGSSIVDYITSGDGDSGAASTAALQALHAEMKNMKWWSAIGVIIDSLIPYVCTVLCTLVIYLMVYSRYIEIAVLTLFAPIGMSNIYSGGMNSSGMKYFKKFLAVCLQGAIMAAIMMVGGLISKEISNARSTFISWLPQILVYLCVAGALIKSKSIANDVIGV